MVLERERQKLQKLERHGSIEITDVRTDVRTDSFEGLSEETKKTPCDIVIKRYTVKTGEMKFRFKSAAIEFHKDGKPYQIDPDFKISYNRVEDKWTVFTSIAKKIETCLQKYCSNLE